MELIKNLITRLRRFGFWLVIGSILVVYLIIGFLYWQQENIQIDLEAQIAKFSAVVARPLASNEELQTEYNAVRSALAPMTPEAALKILVGIAEKSGIDTDSDVGKLSISSPTFGKATVDGGSYQLLSFTNMHVQGDPESVMAFISDLDSGTTLENMVLGSVTIAQVEVTATGEDGARRAEFRAVASAVRAMINDNKLAVVPNPISYAFGSATNLMGDDPNTFNKVEGFPDITATAVAKGYTGTGSPKGGYVLYEHDKISENATSFETVNYIPVLRTKYYYTCESDGTVRQFNGARVLTAKEYLDSSETKIETVATINVNIYIKP